MACVSPPELEDSALLAYLDGEADPQVAAHLEHCAHCRERADRLARVQARLTAQLYRVACPSPQELGEYHLGVLPRDRAAAVSRHLAACPHCAREVEQLRGYLDILAPDVKPGPLDRIRVLVARLADLGSRTPTLAYAGTRGEEKGLRIYQADGAQIAVEVQEDAGRHDRRVLLGLVTGTALRELTAHLWQAGQRVTTVPVDDLGNFVIPDLAPGQYELILSGPQVEIHIQSLDI